MMSMFQSGNRNLAPASAGVAAHARLLASTTGFEKGELPAVVKILNSNGFDGFYENSGSSKGQNGLRVEFGFDGQNLLYYDHTNNQWVLTSKTTGMSARCDPPKPAVLPEHGLWKRDDGSQVRIDITGYNGLPGSNIAAEPEKSEKLAEVIKDAKKTSGNNFDVGVDADGKQINNDENVETTIKSIASGEGTAGGNISTGPTTSNPMVGADVDGKQQSHEVEQRDTTSEPVANGEGMTSSFQPALPTASNPIINQRGNSELDSASEGMTSSFQPALPTASNPIINQRGNSELDSASSQQKPTDREKKTSSGNLSTSSTIGSDSNNLSSDQISRIHDHLADSNGENKTISDLADSQDPKRKFPLGYKILLLSLALLSLICACICTAGNCLSAEKGREESVPCDGVLSDGASDEEDIESKAFMRR